CGSMAFDTIMVFDGRFKDHILPDKVHMLNVAFQVPQLRREFGGCAGNIAYSLKLLGGEGAPMATVGKDFGAYAPWLEKHAIDNRYILAVNDTYTAQAYITTDKDDNQITAFHPGAMNESHQNTVPVDAGIKLGIVAPDGKEGMLQHAEQFAAAGIDFLFDPGQGLPLFDSAQLNAFIERARWVAVNSYEAQMLARNSGLSLEQIAAKVDALIVTQGGEGSHIYIQQNRQNRKLIIPAAKAAVVRDPTGCGDAYRAGLLFGLQNELDWETTGRIASLMGALKIEHYGTQNHHFTQDEFQQQFKNQFGCSF
ncbi:MAG TPA: carbohydrate kinase family protein, partial [Gammaproteobacteria bacterium]|nr:carbohydrate kinase family protein [Gammaproteobacteria bacterium]